MENDLSPGITLRVRNGGATLANVGLMVRRKHGIQFGSPRAKKYTLHNDRWGIVRCHEISWEIGLAACAVGIGDVEGVVSGQQ